MIAWLAIVAGLVLVCIFAAAMACTILLTGPDKEA